MFSRLNRPARYGAIIFQFGIPSGLFIAFGFARLVNMRETFIAALICTAIAFLSWIVGHAMRADQDV
jgi:hypothetical protein